MTKLFGHIACLCAQHKLARMPRADRRLGYTVDSYKMEASDLVRYVCLLAIKVV